MNTESSQDRASDSDPRIAKLVEDVIRRRMAGEDLNDESVIAAHPALMPELGRRLRAFRVAEKAERRLEEIARTRCDDPETAHAEADTELLKLLGSLGYTQVVAAYYQVQSLCAWWATA